MHGIILFLFILVLHISQSKQRYNFTHIIIWKKLDDQRCTKFNELLTYVHTCILVCMYVYTEVFMCSFPEMKY